MMSFLSTSAPFLVSSTVALVNTFLTSTVTIACYATSTRTIASDPGGKTTHH